MDNTHYVTRKLMWPAFCQIFSGFSVMMWSSATFQMGLYTDNRTSTNMDVRLHKPLASSRLEWEMSRVGVIAQLEIFRIQKSSKDPTRKWAFQHLSTPMPEAFQRCLIGWFDYFNSFHQLDQLHGMDILQWSGSNRGNQNLCFYTASHNIAACNYYMFVDFYYWKMLLLKWS